MSVEDNILGNVDGGGSGGVGVQAPPAQQSMSASFPSTTPASTQATGTDGDFSVPEAYKDKTYLKDVKSLDDVYKKLDGAQNLIGQKVTFPTEDSTEEELRNFNRSAGMPENAEDYVFEATGDVPRDAAFDSEIKKLFHDAGLSLKAGSKLQKSFESLMLEKQKQLADQNDDAFDKLSKDVFGDRVDEVLASSKSLIEENIPESLREAFSGLSNEALVTMAAVLDGIKSKYINEDSINDKRGFGDSQGGVDALRKQARELLAHPAKNDPFHEDHKNINDQVTEIYAQIAKLSAK